MTTPGEHWSEDLNEVKPENLEEIRPQDLEEEWQSIEARLVSIDRRIGTCRAAKKRLGRCKFAIIFFTIFFVFFVFGLQVLTGYLDDIVQPIDNILIFELSFRPAVTVVGIVFLLILSGLTALYGEANMAYRKEYRSIRRYLVALDGMSGKMIARNNVRKLDPVKKHVEHLKADEVEIRKKEIEELMPKSIYFYLYNFMQRFWGRRGYI